MDAFNQDAVPFLVPGDVGEPEALDPGRLVSAAVVPPYRKVALRLLRSHRVEFDPRAAAGGLPPDVAVRLRVGVHPDEGAPRDALLLEDIQLLENRRAVGGVGGDGEPGAQVGEREQFHR